MKRAFNIAEELRRAFGAIYDQKMDDWDEANPEPEITPDVQEYAAEIEAGKATVHLTRLKETDWSFSRKLICEIIRTPCSEAAADRHRRWAKARKTHERKLSTARDQFLNRILFDGADHTSLIEDFRNFTPSN